VHAKDARDVLQKAANVWPRRISGRFRLVGQLPTAAMHRHWCSVVSCSRQLVAGMHRSACNFETCQPMAMTSVQYK
jgi:hypothetical protein